MGKRKQSVESTALGGRLVQRTPVNSEIEILPASLIDQINHRTGEKNGVLGRANYFGAMARSKRGAINADQVEARRRTPFDIYGSGILEDIFGGGLYAAPPSGHGLYANFNSHSDGHGLYAGMGLRKAHRIEKGSVGISGSIPRASPQARMSNPYSVNFVWGNTLPPFYQKYNRG